jgi:tryptophanyl-tRNA synthetase
MSKSDPSDASRILLKDSPGAIRTKIRKAVTDSEPTVSYNPESRPGVSNLINIYAAAIDTSVEHAAATFRGASVATLKDRLAAALVQLLAPIKQRYEDNLLERERVNAELVGCASRATRLADMHYTGIARALGLRK